MDLDAPFWAIRGDLLGRVVEFDSAKSRNQVRFAQGPGLILMEVPTEAVEVVEVIE
jgi:hypothetical protein